MDNKSWQCDVCQTFFPRGEELRGDIRGRQICFDCCYSFYKEWYPTIKHATQSHGKKTRKIR